jgi:hypothetical protein
MRKYLAATAATATIASVLLLAPSANAVPIGTGIQRGLAETSLVEKVVRVCQRTVRTGQQICWTDRSRPPTVCHVLRERDGSRRIDCY